MILTRANLGIGTTQNSEVSKFDLTSWFHSFFWLKNTPYLNFRFKNDRIICTWFYRLLRPPSLRFWKIERNHSFSMNVYLKDYLILTVEYLNSIPWITISPGLLVLKSSSKSGLPIAWITGHATIPQPMEVIYFDKFYSTGISP